MARDGPVHRLRWRPGSSSPECHQTDPDDANRAASDLRVMSRGNGVFVGSCWSTLVRRNRVESGLLPSQFRRRKTNREHPRTIFVGSVWARPMNGLGHPRTLASGARAVAAETAGHRAWWPESRGIATPTRSGSVVVRHRDGDIALLVPFVDIPVGLDDLLQGIASVDHRPDLAGLGKLLDEEKVLALFAAA
jgi:hypothetical protein